MDSNAKGFRLQAKAVFLTYSCPVELDQNPITSKEALFAALDSLENVDKLMVGQELHENGKLHFHVYIGFTKRLTTRNAKFFDIMDVHPNIALVRKTAWRVVKYVCKDGNFKQRNCEDLLKEAEKREKVAERAAKRSKLDDVYREALEIAATDADAAEAHVRQHDPRTYTLSAAAIKKTLQATMQQAQREKLEIIETGWKEEYKNIDINELTGDETYKRVHILVGPAGIGKTELALFLLHKAGCKNPIIARSLEYVRDYSGTFDGIVFDECVMNSPMKGPYQWEIEEQIKFVDTAHDSVVRVRYGEVNIPKSMPRILTTNTLLRCINANHEAIARRIKVVALESKLWE